MTLYVSPCLIVAIDGRLQALSIGVSVWNGLESGGLRTRVTVDWGVWVPAWTKEDGTHDKSDASPFEFDGRSEVGTDRKFRIVVLSYVRRRDVEPLPKELSDAFVANNPVLLAFDARLTGFQIRKPIGSGVLTSATAVFEA